MLRQLLMAGCLALPFSVPVAARAQEAPALRVAVQTVRSTFDPAIALGNDGFSVSFNTFDTLIMRNFRSNEAYTGIEFQPGLAVAWESVDDRTTLFTLRDGVTFQNGDPLTADDVAFTFQRIMAPDSLYVAARNQLENIESVEAVDDRTVRIVTRTPDAALFHLLSYPGTSIVPRAYFESVGFEAFGQQPVGTGPYQITSFVADQALTMVANPDYWGGAPAASSVTYAIVPEVTARITALANGEVDIAASIPPDQMPAVQAMNGVSVRRVQVNSHVLNYNTFLPFLDRDLRQALNLAIDRDLLARALWSGSAEVLRGHQYPEWGPLYAPDRPGFAYDPDRARALIEASAYDGEEIVFHTHPVYYTNGLAAAEAVVEMWRNVGLNARVQVNERWAVIQRDDPSYGVRNVSDWTILSDPAATISWTWGLAGMWDDKAEFLALAARARAELDPEARRALYQQMLDIFETEAPGTVLYRVYEAYGVSDRIDWHPYTNYMMDFRAGSLAFRN